MESGGNFTLIDAPHQVDLGGVAESREPSAADPVEEGVEMKTRTQGKRAGLTARGLRESVVAGRLLSPSYPEGQSRNPATHAWRAWEGCGVT